MIATADGRGCAAMSATRARTEEERHYYALMEKAWRILAPFYDAIVYLLKRLRRDVAAQAGVGPGSYVLDGLEVRANELRVAVIRGRDDRYSSRVIAHVRASRNRWRRMASPCSPQGADLWAASDQ
jgi:pyruvate-formate lyase-activating enzyme